MRLQGSNLNTKIDDNNSIDRPLLLLGWGTINVGPAVAVLLWFWRFLFVLFFPLRTHTAYGMYQAEPCLVSLATTSMSQEENRYGQSTSQTTKYKEASRHARKHDTYLILMLMCAHG